MGRWGKGIAHGKAEHTCTQNTTTWQYGFAVIVVAARRHRRCGSVGASVSAYPSTASFGRSVVQIHRNQYCCFCTTVRKAVLLLLFMSSAHEGATIRPSYEVFILGLPAKHQRHGGVHVYLVVCNVYLVVCKVVRDIERMDALECWQTMRCFLLPPPTLFFHASHSAHPPPNRGRGVLRCDTVRLLRKVCSNLEQLNRHVYECNRSTQAVISSPLRTTNDTTQSRK